MPGVIRRRPLCTCWWFFSPGQIDGLFKAAAGVGDVDKITAIAARYGTQLIGPPAAGDRAFDLFAAGITPGFQRLNFHIQPTTSQSGGWRALAIDTVSNQGKKENRIMEMQLARIRSTKSTASALERRRRRSLAPGRTAPRLLEFFEFLARV